MKMTGRNIHTPEAERNRKLWQRFIKNIFGKFDGLSFEDKIKWYEANK